MSTERAMSCDEVRDLAPAYVLGALERDDEAAVSNHLRTCRNPHPEMEELGAVVPALAEAVEPLDPRAELRGRILAAARAEPRHPAAAPEADRAEAATSPAAVVVPLARRGTRWLDASPAAWALRAAAVIAIVALGAWNLLLQGRVSDLDRYQAAVAAVTQAASQPGSLSAVLTPAAPGSGSQGVGAVRSDGTIVLAMSGLDATSGAEVYEAWVVPPGGAPVPVGSFTVGGEGVGVLTAGKGPVVDGGTLALTREPGPGATTPTLPIVSAGTARAAPST